MGKDAQRRSWISHCRISDVAERRLAEVVDHESKPRKALGERNHVIEVARVDDRRLEDQIALLEQRDALEHRRLHDPVVWLVMDQMADGAQLWPALKLIESRGGELRSQQIDPGGHSADQLVRRGSSEEIVRVGVETGPLDEDHGVDAVAFDQRLDVGGTERAVDRDVLLGHPRLRRARRIPEVDVRVDPHAAPTGCPSRAAAFHTSPPGNS